MEGIDIWCHTEDIVVWYILRKSFFGIKNDIYLGNVYIVPENSAYLRDDEFYILYQHIEKIPDNSEVLLCGEYNAQTGEVPDFEAHVFGTNGDLENLLPPEDKENHRIVEYLFKIDMLNRHSMDGNLVNKHGRQLIEFCKATGMLILNGRLGRDRGIGCFTRDDTTGRSVVDYAIIIDYFEVLHKFPESDHRPVSLSLTCSSSITPGGRLNKKDGLTRYGDSHVKDKTSYRPSYL